MPQEDPNAGNSDYHFMLKLLRLGRSDEGGASLSAGAANQGLLVVPRVGLTDVCRRARTIGGKEKRGYLAGNPFCCAVGPLTVNQLLPGPGVWTARYGRAT